ncbi:MAG TPA: type II toxin-antitoxin system RelE/ParE family toxin [Candidatus Paceibacterota bacterium]|jgi:mRNA-degrading endonuclease RelE of RelBE toxin-antitoxin system|nr:type II toxin-antitoxin system RelE/ParE family toxin [Candidatus Paceibacterota bacterium]
MKVSYMPLVIAQLEKMPVLLAQRITDKIDWYADQPDPLAFAKRLEGRVAYRYRVGDHRIIFAVAEGTLNILTIVPRDKAYRGL